MKRKSDYFKERKENASVFKSIKFTIDKSKEMTLPDVRPKETMWRRILCVQSKYHENRMARKNKPIKSKAHILIQSTDCQMDYRMSLSLC